MSNKIKFFLLHFFPPLFIGTVAFFLVLGPRILDPSNIAWLSSGDPSQHFLGWHFFRNSPWTFPIGLNPNFGLELSNAVVYSDSNPLLSFIFKPFSPILPKVFQYFGYWLLACFILQSWFSWKLMSLISKNNILKFFGMGLFVFSVPMIGRMGGHMSLAAHFLILAGLYLTLHRHIQNRGLLWGILLIAASLIHAYLLAMVALLWLSDIFGKIKLGKLSIRDSCIEFFLIVSVVAIAMWQAGYFSVGRSASAAGFGYYRMNLLSIFDSSGWSYVLKDIPQGEGDYEGLSFLGLGVIFLVIIALPLLRKNFSALKLINGKSPFLIYVLVGLALFSLSNNVGIGSLEWKYFFPHQFLGIANVFRASGRMFWPVFYVIIFTILYLIVRGYENRTAIYLFGIAFFIQIIDTSAAWRGIQSRLMTNPSATWDSALTDPFWEEASRRYRKVRWVLPDNHSPNWKSLSAYAGTHDLSTDAIYLARIDTKALKAARTAALHALNTGNYQLDSLYIMDDAAYLRAAMSIDPTRHTLAKINGLNVLAPGWKECTVCSPIGKETKLADLIPPIEAGKKMLMNDHYSVHHKYLLGGWSSPEPWGTWSDGDSAEIIFPLSEKVESVTIEGRAFVNTVHPKQDVEIKVNDIMLFKTSITKSDDLTVKLTLPADLQKTILTSGLMRIDLRFLNAASPRDIGVGDDERKLAVGIHAITINRRF